MKAAARRTIASLLLGVGLALALLYLFANKQAGTFGIAVDMVEGTPAARVQAVAAGSEASKSGIRPGDLIRAAGPSGGDRAALYELANPPLIAAGDRPAVSIQSGARRRPATLVAATDPDSPPYEAAYFSILAVPILLLGWLIIWKKPESSDATTLGVMLLLLGWWVATPDRLGPPLGRFFLSEIASSAFVILAVMTAAIFFARYPEGRGTRNSALRRTLLYVAIAITAVELILMAASFIVPAYAGVQPWIFPPTIVGEFIRYFTIFACFIMAFRAGDQAERTRLRWLGGSFFLGFAGPMLIPAAIFFLGSHFTVIDQVLLESTLFILAIGFAYGILRLRVFDIAFVLNRAAVYALTTTVVIGMFAALQWFVNRLLSQSNYAFALQIAGAILIGLSLQRLYGYAETLISRYLFARLHAARLECARIARALTHVESMPAAQKLLTSEVAAALDLESAALFARGGDGSFKRCMDFNWDHTQRAVFEPHDSLPLYLNAEAAPLALHKLHRTIADVPPGKHEPVVALPIMAKRELAAFVLYGGHPSGADLDPDEIAELKELGVAGTRAFESLSLAERVIEANRGREEAQQAQVEQLRTVNEAYARFVPTEFLELLGKDDIRQIALGDHVQKAMTVFFCDIRSFTRISSQMSAADNFAFINAYMRRAGPLIREHRGFIDKYIGDSIMGLFPKGADDAVGAAVALHHELRLYNKRRETRGYEPLDVGIGIHTGTLMLGTVGERGRMDSTVISDAVNVASRLEELTKVYGASIILSDATYWSLPDPERFLLRRLGNAQVRGKSEPIAIWEAYDGDASEVKSQKHAAAAEFDAGVKRYEAAEVATAREHFARCLAVSPEDRPAQYFLELCRNGSA